MGFRRPLAQSGLAPSVPPPPSTVVNDGMFPENFPNYRRQLANVVNGTGNLKLLCAGDSKLWGTTTTAPTNPPGPGGLSWPSKMQALLNIYFLPSVIGLSIPMCYTANSPASDTRWVTAGWQSGTNFGYGIGANSSWIGVTGVADMTFTPGIASADTFDVYYVQTAGLGKFKVAIDGASSGGTSFNSGSGATGVAKATVSAGASGTHVLHIGSVTVASIIILGIDAYFSTGAAIRVGNAGVPSCSAIQYADQTAGPAGLLSPQVGSLATIKAYAPDLTILSLGGAIDGVLFPGEFSAYQQAILSIIAAAQASGDVIVTSGIPTLAATSTATTVQMESQAAPWLQQLAATTGIGFIDLYSPMQPSALYNTLGYYNPADNFHLTVTGYADVGRAVFRALSNLS